MPPDGPAARPAPDDLPPLEAIDEEPDAPQVLVVRVAADRLAVRLEELHEVVRNRPGTPLPGAPPWVTGLVALRSTLVPVGDLVRREAAPEETVADAPWLVLVHRGGHVAALGVSSVEGVHPVEPDERRPIGYPPTTLPRRTSVRLIPREAGGALGAPIAVDVLDVAALFAEIFEGD